MDVILKDFFARLDAAREQAQMVLPDNHLAREVADGLFHLLFPTGKNSSAPAGVQYGILHHQLVQLLKPLLGGQLSAAQTLADGFFAGLPHLYQSLQEDSEAFFKFDPAATCVEEVVSTYPGFYAIALYRMANLLYQYRVPLLPRVWTEYAHGRTGIDIHPGASIGKSFFIDHGTGVVIGATSVIGNHVKIYQGVTLGALQVDKSLANVKRHPTIEDYCILYANSTILGGKTKIGHNSIIGGNVWITESVEPYSVVLHRPDITVRSRAIDEVINFVI